MRQKLQQNLLNNKDSDNKELEIGFKMSDKKESELFQFAFTDYFDTRAALLNNKPSNNKQAEHWESNTQFAMGFLNMVMNSTMKEIGRRIRINLITDKKVIEKYKECEQRWKEKK